MFNVQELISTTKEFEENLPRLLALSIDENKLNKVSAGAISMLKTVEERHARFEASGLEVDQAMKNQLIKLKIKVLEAEQKMILSKSLRNIYKLMNKSISTYKAVNGNYKSEVIAEFDGLKRPSKLNASQCLKVLRHQFNTISTKHKAEVINALNLPKHTDKIRVKNDQLLSSNMEDFGEKLNTILLSNSIKQVFEFHTIVSREFYPSELLELYVNYLFKNPLNR